MRDERDGTLTYLSGPSQWNIACLDSQVRIRTVNCVCLKRCILWLVVCTRQLWMVVTDYFVTKCREHIFQTVEWIWFQGEPISDDDLFIAVKTCEKFHKTRGMKQLYCQNCSYDITDIRIVVVFSISSICLDSENSLCYRKSYTNNL